VHRAKWLLAQGEFSEEELTALSGADPPSFNDGEP